MNQQQLFVEFTKGLFPNEYLDKDILIAVMKDTALAYVNIHKIDSLKDNHEIHQCIMWLYEIYAELGKEKGTKRYWFLDENMGNLAKKFGIPYDPQDNPEGVLRFRDFMRGVRAKESEGKMELFS